MLFSLLAGLVNENMLEFSLSTSGYLCPENGMFPL